MGERRTKATTKKKGRLWRVNLVRESEKRKRTKRSVLEKKEDKPT